MNRRDFLFSAMISVCTIPNLIVNNNKVQAENKTDYIDRSFEIDGEQNQLLIDNMMPGLSYSFDGKYLKVCGNVNKSLCDYEKQVWRNPIGEFLPIKIKFPNSESIVSHTFFVRTK